MFKIWGRVTDFNGNPMERAALRILNKRFETVYQTYSDAEGRYCLSVEKGTYIAMWACKDYAVENLEYWAWNIMAYQDLEINPRIDGLEVYAVNAWIPQGGMPSVQIYFRPMSLKRLKQLSQRLGLRFPPSPGDLSALNIIDIAPSLTGEDIEVFIDGEPVRILEVNRVKEAAGEKQSIYGYLIQTSLPKVQRDSNHSQISIVVNDSETVEKGEACLFCKRIWELPDSLKSRVHGASWRDCFHHVLQVDA